VNVTQPPGIAKQSIPYLRHKRRGLSCRKNEGADGRRDMDGDGRSGSTASLDLNSLRGAHKKKTRSETISARTKANFTSGGARGLGCDKREKARTENNS